MLGSVVRLRAFVAQQRDVTRNPGGAWRNACVVQGGFLRLSCKHLVVEAILGAGQAPTQQMLS